MQDDSIAEADESFPIMLERSDTLDSRIELSASASHLAIIGDEDGKCVLRYTVIIMTICVSHSQTLFYSYDCWV